MRETQCIKLRDLNFFFWAEVGCQFPQLPFIAPSRGWSAEDMERNVCEVQNSRELRDAAQQLVTRAADMAK